MIVINIIAGENRLLKLLMQKKFQKSDEKLLLFTVNSL